MDVQLRQLVMRSWGAWFFFFFFWKNWFVFHNPPRVGSTPPVICFNCLQLRAAASVPSSTLLLNIIIKNILSQWRSFRFDVVTQICDINYPGLSPVDSGDGSDICSACLQDASLWRLFLSHREGTTARKIKNMLEGSDTPSGLAMPQDPHPPSKCWIIHRRGEKLLF